MSAQDVHTSVDLLLVLVAFLVCVGVVICLALSLDRSWRDQEPPDPRSVPRDEDDRS